MADFSPYADLPPPTTAQSLRAKGQVAEAAALPDAPSKSALKPRPAPATAAKRAAPASSLQPDPHLPSEGGPASAAAAEAMPVAKRPRNVGFAVASESGAVRSPPSETGAVTPSVADDKLHLLLDKLRTVLSDDRKFARGVTVLCRAMGASLSKQTAPLFATTVRVALSPFSRVVRPALATALRELFGCLREHKRHFEGHQAFEADTWAAADAAMQLLTDDSFQFARAVKALQATLADMEQHMKAAGGAQLEDEGMPALVRARQEALLQAMEVVYTQSSKTWTRSSVDQLFKSMQDKRLLFPDTEAMRGRLDKLTNTLRAKRASSALNTTRNKASGGGGGFSW